MAKPRRENDSSRKGGPWPSPIGMGALVGYGDFVRDKERQAHHKAEEAEYESGGMDAVNAYRKRTGYNG